MKRWVLTFVFAIGSTFAQGSMQTVVPVGFQNRPGNTGDSILEGGGEFQELFRASSLPTEFQGPVLVTGLAFRVSQQPLSYQAVVPRIEIQLSTSSRTPDQMLLAYSANRGADRMTVYLHDNVSLFGSAGQSPNSFDLRFTFDQPFVYDAKAGSLLLFVQTTGAGGGSRTIDAQNLGGLSTTPASYVGTTGPFGANQVVAYSPIVQFSLISVPEPSIKLLMAGAVCTIFKVRRLRR